VVSDTRQHAHELIDQIPEAQLSTAIGLLEKLVDPVTLALLNAPFDDEPVTEEEAREIAESEEWLRQNGGKGIPHEEAMRQVGTGRRTRSWAGRPIVAAACFQ
jgi:hypothetical protein